MKVQMIEPHFNYTCTGFR